MPNKHYRNNAFAEYMLQYWNIKLFKLQPCGFDVCELRLDHTRHILESKEEIGLTIAGTVCIDKMQPRTV